MRISRNIRIDTVIKYMYEFVLNFFVGRTPFHNSIHGSIIIKSPFSRLPYLDLLFPMFSPTRNIGSCKVGGLAFSRKELGVLDKNAFGLNTTLHLRVFLWPAHHALVLKNGWSNQPNQLQKEWSVVPPFCWFHHCQHVNTRQRQGVLELGKCGERALGRPRRAQGEIRPFIIWGYPCSSLGSAWRLSLPPILIRRSKQGLTLNMLILGCIKS